MTQQNVSAVSPNVMCMRAAKSGLAGGWLMAAVATLVYALICGLASYTAIGILLLYGPMYFGYIRYLINQNDRHESDFNLLFSGFSRFAEVLVAGLLAMLIISVGTILLIVPGIIAGCGLSMTFFLMADNPSMSGVDALKQSWQMMQGHKWDYFCLCFRFIGWILLSILTAGILMFWIQPYMECATLHFYRRLRNTAPVA